VGSNENDCYLLAAEADGERGDGQVALLVDELAHDAVPLAIPHLRAVQAVLHQADRVGEIADLGDLLQQVHAEALVLGVSFPRFVAGRRGQLDPANGSH